MSPTAPILLFLLLTFISHGSSVPFLIDTYCPNTTFFSATNAAYRSNINTLLSSLTTAANRSTTPGFNYTSTNTSTSAAVYGLYLCRGDDNPATCKDCVATASAKLAGDCLRGKQAVVWYDECMIRYSNESFYGQLESDHYLIMWNTQNTTNATDQLNYGFALAMTADNVTDQAVKGEHGKRVGTDEEKIDDSHTMYVLGQCTPDLSANDCKHCLQQCRDALHDCCAHHRGARVLFFSCNLRYEMYLFYDKISVATPVPSVEALSPPPVSGTGGSPEPNPQKIRKRSMQHIPVIITGSVILVVLLLMLALWLFVYKRKAEEASTDDSDITTAESLQMEFNTIRAATHNFAMDKKLGQGGFGEVYKGTLENGQDIAVKRLSGDSGQGITEFKTEVLLVAKLQHRNLVKLLGFCISGQEKILVYEFLPNSSLDKILFDPTKRMTLNWETRFKIISGIAKGLLYLHEDSRLRIVHRDLKSSNILLDEAMNPKISDFGLAKLFGVDQTQDATNTIVGTYGYMAPEYILTGHYSMKSDVYAFGIIMLEIVSGQRNKYQNGPQLEGALLYRAWRLWNEGASLKLVDETLGNNYTRDDMMKCIHIGLLCIQENVTKRPYMTSVVAALGGQSIDLPLPAPPSFFGADDSVSTSVNSGQGTSVYRISDITELDPR